MDSFYEAKIESMELWKCSKRQLSRYLLGDIPKWHSVKSLKRKQDYTCDQI